MSRLVLARTADAATEPVTAAEAKAHLRVDHADDDAYIGTLITAARQHVEEWTSRALVTQTWELKLDRFPASGAIALPRPPLQGVTAITYIDDNGASQTLAADQYTVHTSELPGRVTRAYEVTWPSTRAVPNAVTVTYTAGYGAAAAVPNPIKQALLLIVGDLYRNREDTITGTVAARLKAVDALIGPYRTWWF